MGSHRLFTLLSLLFECMLVHGFTPEDLLESVIVSIPKDTKGKLSISDNYRGISLCSCFCKVFDLIVIDLCGSQLQTSDLQFAYKKGHSTVMCTSVLKDIVANYMSHGSNVYSCLLDASKAFDKMHFGKMFRLLIERNFSANVIRLLLDMYLRQKVKAKWKNEVSAAFSVANGVRQGGVLSPLLFSVYMDELVKRLREKGIGCYVGSHFAGVLVYADDVTLLSPSRAGLQEMLNVCAEFAKEYRITYNEEKTECILFCKQSIECPRLLLNNVWLKWKKHVRHLGVYVNYNLDDNVDIRYKRWDFIYSLNDMCTDFSSLSCVTLNALFGSYCCSFYGSQSWNLYNTDIDHVNTMYNKGIRRVWRLPYNAHKSIIFNLSGLRPFRNMLVDRFSSFYAKMCKVENQIVNQVALRARENCCSFIGANLRYTEHFDRIVYVVPPSVLDILFELIQCRESHMDLDGFSYDMVHDMICDIATR